MGRKRQARSIVLCNALRHRDVGSIEYAMHGHRCCQSVQHQECQGFASPQRHHGKGRDCFGSRALVLDGAASTGQRRAGRRPREAGSSSDRYRALRSSILRSRSSSWTESFARGQMFLSLLSSAVVALALVAQVTALRGGFTAFALVLLPVVWLLGMTTFVRLVAVNVDENRWVIGMNRIRGAYLEIAPHLGRYFVTGHHDDDRGVMVTAGWGTFPRLYGFVTTPAVPTQSTPRRLRRPGG